MRPRSFERGNTIVGGIEVTRVIDFNEAALFRTRKLRIESEQSWQRWHFNEAALFRTRKLVGNRVGYRI